MAAGRRSQGPPCARGSATAGSRSGRQEATRSPSRAPSPGRWPAWSRDRPGLHAARASRPLAYGSAVTAEVCLSGCWKRARRRCSSIPIWTIRYPIPIYQRIGYRAGMKTGFHWSSRHPELPASNLAFPRPGCILEGIMLLAEQLFRYGPHLLSYRPASSPACRVSLLAPTCQTAVSANTGEPGRSRYERTTGSMTPWAGVPPRPGPVRGGGGGYLRSRAAENTMLLSTALPRSGRPAQVVGRHWARRGGGRRGAGGLLFGWWEPPDGSEPRGASSMTRRCRCSSPGGHRRWPPGSPGRCRSWDGTSAASTRRSRRPTRSRPRGASGSTVRPGAPALPRLPAHRGRGRAASRPGPAVAASRRPAGSA